ncbi:MAG: hypothetical protein ABI692_02980 [Terracoccus sp.]
MDSRVMVWFLGPVGLILAVTALARWWAAPTLDRRAARLRRTAVLATVVSYLVADRVLTGSIVGDQLHPAVPAVAATVGVGICGIAERWAPTPAGEQRAASLTIRRGTEPGRLMPPYVVGLALSVGALGLGYATSGADGVSGSRHWAQTAVTTAPYPGRSYTWPTLAALALLAATTWWALRRVEARPAQIDDPRLDRALRLGSRIRVLRWAGAGSLLTAGGLCLTIGPKLNELTQQLRQSAYLAGGSPAPNAPWDWTQNVGFAMTVLGLGALVTALCVVISIPPAVPRSQPFAVPTRS